MLLITTAIIAAVVLSGGNKKGSEKSNTPAVARTVKAEEPIAPKTQPVSKEAAISEKFADAILLEKLKHENGERTRSVDSVPADNLEGEESDKDEVVPVAAEEPTLPESEEQEDVASEVAYTNVATTEENGSEVISSDPAETAERAAADDDVKEEEQVDAQPEDSSQYPNQSTQDGQDQLVGNEGEEVLERDAEAEMGQQEEEEVAEYDESEYHPEDVNQDFYYDEDQEERPSLTLDTCHSGDASSATTPLSKSSRSLSTDPSGDVSGGLSPMKHSSSYKFGSHYQHKKVGASWVKDGNSQGSFSAASPVTVSPMRHSLPRKVIPLSDQDKPLSTKQSTKISQCKLYFSLSCVSRRNFACRDWRAIWQSSTRCYTFSFLYISFLQTRKVCRRRRTK